MTNSFLRRLIHLGCASFSLSACALAQENSIEHPRTNDLFDQFRSAFHSDQADQISACRCADFEFADYLTLPNVSENEVSLDRVVIWVEPARSEQEEIFFSGLFNNPRFVLQAAGIMSSFTDDREAANFRISYRDVEENTSEIGLRGSTYKNDQCFIENDGTLDLVFFANPEPLDDAAHNARALCVGNAIIEVLGLPIQLDENDVYPVSGFGEAPSGITVEYRNNLVGMRRSRPISCLTSAYRFLGNHRVSFSQYLETLLRAREAEDSSIQQICHRNQ
ncbi:MAG: hypothetical protein P8P99_10710 [Maricaulis sp.]|nr:hypothetical protein [Maricaulis sp.]